MDVLACRGYVSETPRSGSEQSLHLASTHWLVMEDVLLGPVLQAHQSHSLAKKYLTFFHLIPAWISGLTNMQTTAAARLGCWGWWGGMAQGGTVSRSATRTGRRTHGRGRGSRADVPRAMPVCHSFWNVSINGPLPTPRLHTHTHTHPLQSHRARCQFWALLMFILKVLNKNEIVIWIKEEISCHCCL